MPTKTEDNSLVAQYIRAIENPDSVGFQRGMVDNYWYQPSKRGYDPNNRGFGIDVVENKKTKKVVRGRTGKWLTEAEERALRNAHIDASKEVLEKWTPQILAAPPSEAKQAMAIGMLYRGDGIKNILNNPALRDAFYSGSDADFQKAVSDFYQAKQFGERAQNHDKFMNTQPQPTAWPYDSFQPKTSFKEGGQLKPKQWQDLSMAEKATMMRAAVEEGIYDLPTIKAKYNEFAEGGHIYDGTSENSQQMKIGHPHYSYDEDGNIKKTSEGKPILNFNVTLPEVVITPDSTKSPGERAVLERYRRQQYDRTHGAGIYNALLDGEQTKLAIAKRQNEWNNSTQKKALDYAQAAASGIGIGADIVSGYPVYSTLKGLRTAQEATTPEEYVEAGLWLAPALAGRGKEILTKGASLLKKSPKPSSKPFVSELNWSPEEWLGKNRVTGKYDAEDAKALKSHLPEYLQIEQQAKANGTWLKMPDGSTWEGDPRSWVQLMSNDGRKLSQQRLFHGDSNFFVDSEGNDLTADVIGKRIIWTSTNKHLPHTYGNRRYELTIPKDVPNSIFDAEGRNWKHLSGLSKNKYEDTNDVSYDLLKNDNTVTINNVVDVGHDPRWQPGKNGIPDIFPEEEVWDYQYRVFKGNDVIIGKDVPRKSLLGNNGNFELSNKNIYKGLIPLALGNFVPSANREK